MKTSVNDAKYSELSTRIPTPAPSAAQHSPDEFIAHIVWLVSGNKPSNHLWNYCLDNADNALRSMNLMAEVKRDSSSRKVLAHHQLLPGKVSANTEALMEDLMEAVRNQHATLLAEKAALVAALEKIVDRDLLYFEGRVDGGQISMADIYQGRAALALARQ